MYRSKLKCKVIDNLKDGKTIIYDDLVFRNKNGIITRQKDFNATCIIKEEFLDFFISVDHLNEDDIYIS